MQQASSHQTPALTKTTRAAVTLLGFTPRAAPRSEAPDDCEDQRMDDGGDGAELIDVARACSKTAGDG